MGHNKSWDKVSSYTQLLRKFFKTVTDGIQRLNHLRPDGNKLLLTRPNSNKSKTMITCFCPVRIQHPLSRNPFLYCSDELVLATLFQKHPDAIEELGCHLKSLIRVFIANSFEKWCYWNHSKECVILVAERFASISVDEGLVILPELLLLLQLRQ